MNIELNLLRSLTSAIDAVNTTAAIASDAFKVAFAAPVTEAKAAKFASMEADTRSAHAKHEYSAVLSDARAYLASMASTGHACHG